MSDDGKSVPERAAEVFVYAPVGVAMYLRDTVPTFLGLFVNRGRNEVKKYSKDARKQVDQAKSMGEFAVCLLYTSPSPRDGLLSRMPSSA